MQSLMGASPWPVAVLIAAALLVLAAVYGRLRRAGFTLAPGRARREIALPEAALARLEAGSRRFSRGELLSLSGRKRLAELAKQQQPFAVLVGCSDSRVAPELIFGCGLGDLFVVRMAGNTVGERGLGSIVYGVTVLEAPLIVVLGHARCGAVEAAARMAEDEQAFSGALKEAIRPIVPAVLKAKAAGAPDLVAAAVRENVRSIVERLKGSEPEIVDRVRDGRLKIVGAYYDLVTGDVEFFA
jgi:carbonic anhydrase